MSVQDHEGPSVRFNHVLLVERVRARRTREDLTMIQLAEQVGVALSVVTRYFRNRPKRTVSELSTMSANTVVRLMFWLHGSDMDIRDYLMMEEK